MHYKYKVNTRLKSKLELNHWHEKKCKIQQISYNFDTNIFYYYLKENA